MQINKIASEFNCLLISTLAQGDTRQYGGVTMSSVPNAIHLRYKRLGKSAVSGEYGS